MQESFRHHPDHRIFIGFMTNKGIGLRKKVPFQLIRDSPYFFDKFDVMDDCQKAFPLDPTILFKNRSHLLDSHSFRNGDMMAEGAAFFEQPQYCGRGQATGNTVFSGLKLGGESGKMDEHEVTNIISKNAGLSQQTPNTPYTCSFGDDD